MEKNVLYGNINKNVANVKHETLGSVVFKSLKKHGSNVAQIDGITGKSQTYSDILEASCLLAQILKFRGLTSNDFICICSENRLEFCIPVIAALYLGIACVPMNPGYATNELINGLNITKPKYIFCSESSLKTVSEAVKQCHFITDIIAFDDVLSTTKTDYKVTLFFNLLKPQFPAIRVDDFKPIKFDSYRQTAAVLSSSGTTGLPKGVIITHSNIKAFIRAVQNPRGLLLTDKDVFLGLLPFFHAYGYSMVIYSIITGISVVILPRFEEQLFLTTIEKYKITFIPIVPSLMLFLAKHPLVDKYDLSSIKELICSAAPLGEDIFKLIKQRLGVNQVRQGFGMTELLGLITCTAPGVNKPNSVGTLLDEAQAKVINIETGEALGPDQVGELCFRGPQVMQGYFNNDEATKETIDAEGWLHTGDVGYYDKNQYFYIIDRLKEMIKYKGYQVAPAEIESLILTNPDVKDAAVIGVPDEECGELPKAFVVKQPGSNICENDIIKFVASNISAQKRLRGGVEFIDTIPKNSTGKILRKILRLRLKSES